MCPHSQVPQGGETIGVIKDRLTPTPNLTVFFYRAYRCPVAGTGSTPWLSPQGSQNNGTKDAVPAIFREAHVMFSNRVFAAAVASVFAALLMSTPAFMMSAPAFATPATVTDKDNKVIPRIPRWPRGTTIHVYISNDARSADLRAGIERWSSLLADRGLTIDVQQGPVPAGAINAVGVNFVDPSSLATGNRAETRPQGSTATRNGQPTVGPLTGGTINVGNDVTGSDFLRNLAQHEFGHALGLADEPTQVGQPHNVMDHNVDSTGTTTFTDKDKQEIGSVYASVQLPTATGTMLAQVQGNTLLYTAEWQSGSTIPLVQIGTNGAPVFDITTEGFSVAGTNALDPNPAGWFLLDPTNPASLVGTVEDFSAIFAGPGGDYLTFINFLDPLGPDHTSAEFSFTSFTGIASVLTFLAADNFVTTVGPAPIPEPSSLYALFGGIMALFAALRYYPRGRVRHSNEQKRG